MIAHASLYCPDVAASMAFWVRYAPLGSDTDRVQLVADTRGPVSRLISTHRRHSAAT
ncbi:hypothetical protein PEQA60_41150 [Pseudomonas sp. Eqa60]|nr:hypothetical protein PEQA60_41150 [Pseudomonas sp. Eqa60]